MAESRKAEVTAAQNELDVENKTYQAVIETSMGDITVDLLPEVAPGHVKNFLGLAKIGFYDGGCFHRVIQGFMIQGGCPDGNGMGGPGYHIDAEFNKTPHTAGVLSMARATDPNSAGSQFFICLDKHLHLDGSYTAFGKTADAKSLEVVEAIGDVETGANDKPVSRVEIRSVRVQPV